MADDPSFIFQCRSCGREEKISWAKVPTGEDGIFQKEIKHWCATCAEFGHGEQIFTDTGRRMSSGTETIIPRCLN